MTDLRTAAQQALEALEIGYDSAKAEADQFHSAMAGYRPQRHAEMDADVQKIARAITALRTALATGDNLSPTEPVQEPVGWLENPFGSFRRNWLWKLDPPPQTLAWSIPLYTAPPQRPAKAVQEPDLSRCPKCGGPADNGHDRSIPPNPYHCTKCMEQDDMK